MTKATEIKLGNDRNGSSTDRRRGMKLVSTQPASRSRRQFNIGISSNVFSETGPTAGNSETANLENETCTVEPYCDGSTTVSTTKSLATGAADNATTRHAARRERAKRVAGFIAHPTRSIRPHSRRPDSIRDWPRRPAAAGRPTLSDAESHRSDR